MFPSSWHKGRGEVAGIQRRPLLILILLSLAACRSQANVLPTAAPFIASPIQIAVVTNDFTVGTPRVPLVIYDGPRQVADVQAVTVTAVDLGDEARPEVWSGSAVNYSDFEVPYWVVYPELSHQGIWGLQIEAMLADNRVVEAQTVIEAAERPQTPAIGEPAPPSQNRTLHTEPDIHKLTTALEPDPLFYQMTVAEALASRQPSVIVFATPGLCRTAVCAPVLESARAVQATVGEQANFIHLEIYQDFEALTPAREVDEWGLSSEPWIFVLDAGGRVAARLGGPVSPRELAAVLDRLLP